MNSSFSPSFSHTTRPSVPTGLSTSRSSPSFKTTKDVKVKKTAFQAKPRVLFVGDSFTQKLKFRKMDVLTKNTIKTAKGYGSVGEGRTEKKNENMTDVTKLEL